MIGEEEGESSYEWFIGETADGSFTSVGTTTVNEYTFYDKVKAGICEDLEIDFSEFQ